MRLLLAVLALDILQAIAAVVATGPAWRRALALCVSASALALPWTIPAEHRFWRAVVAVACAVASWRIIDLALETRPWPPLRRVWHAIALLDTTRLRRAAPALDGKALAGTVAYGALTAGAAWASLVLGPHLEGWRSDVVRFGGGAVLIYAMLDAGYAAIALALRAVGIVVYDLHRAPALSRTVRELWGERWARTVSLWLFARTFRPLARRGWPRLGLAASFAASALLHAYGILPALGWVAAGSWGLFFVVQAGVVLLERALGVARWPRPLAHAFVLGTMFASSPLMVGPFLRLF